MTRTAQMQQDGPNDRNKKRSVRFETSSLPPAEELEALLYELPPGPDTSPATERPS